MLGPIRFIAYSAEVVGIVEQQGFNVHIFSRWLTGLWGRCAARCCSPSYSDVHSASRASRRGWVPTDFVLTPSKTELIWLGSSRRLHHCSSTGGMSVSLSLSTFDPDDFVRDLGLLIDSGMSLAKHVNYFSGICFFQLRQLWIIRRSLTADAAHALVCALVTHMHTDYCNRLLVSCSSYLTDKLQACRSLNKLPYCINQVTLTDFWSRSGQYSGYYSGPEDSGFESRVGANILWGSIDCTGLNRAFIPPG